MIVYKKWSKRMTETDRYHHWDGWFLCGFIPLLIRRVI